MIDGATPAPLLFLFSRLIFHCEFLCLFLVDETCLKLYPLSIVHPTLPCKHVIVYLFFDHCLLVEGSQLLDIVLLIVWLVTLGIECFCLKELFEAWRCLYLHQSEHSFPICIESEDGYPHNAWGPIIKAHDVHHCLVFWRNVCYHIVHWFLFLCVKYMQWIFRTLSVWNRKIVFLRGL